MCYAFSIHGETAFTTINSRCGLTREATHIHLLQVLRFQNDNSQFAGSRDVAEGEADVPQFLLL